MRNIMCNHWMLASSLIRDWIDDCLDVPQIWAASPSWKAWLCALLWTALRRRQELPGHRWSESQGPWDKAARIISAVLLFTEIPNLHICSWEDPDRFRWICEGLLPRMGFKFRFLIDCLYLCMSMSIWKHIVSHRRPINIYQPSSKPQPLQVPRPLSLHHLRAHMRRWHPDTVESPRRPFNFKSCTAQHHNFVANSSRKSKTAPLRLHRKTTVFLSFSALKSLMPHPSQPVSAGSELFFGTFCFNFLHNRWQQNEPLRIRKEHIVGTTGIFGCLLHSPDNYWGSYFELDMCVLEQACWCRCRVPQQGAARMVLLPLWSWPAGAAWRCSC